MSAGGLIGKLDDLVEDVERRGAGFWRPTPGRPGDGLLCPREVAVEQLTEALLDDLERADGSLPGDLGTRRGARIVLARLVGDRLDDLP